MKKMTLIICVVMIGSILVFANNSFAAREMRGHQIGRGGHYQKWHKPAYYQHGWAWGHHPRFYHRRFQNTVVREINYYYGSTENYYEPEDEFNASASVSDTGFSISIGVRRTD